MEQKIIVQNEAGIHARPAALLVKTAAKFGSEITIEVNDRVINAKSIMNILSAGLKKGDEIRLKVSGSDEQEALQTLVELFEAKFNEE